MMKRIFASFVLLLSLTAITPMARADDASKRAKAEKLITVMHADQIIAQMKDAMQSQLSGMIASMDGSDKFNAEQKQLVAEFQKKLIDLSFSALNWETLRPVYVDVYMKAFSEEEIDAMSNFYSTPVGQSVLQKMPQVMQLSLNETQGIVKGLTPKIQALSEGYQKKIAAAGDKSKP